MKVNGYESEWLTIEAGLNKYNKKELWKLF